MPLSVLCPPIFSLPLSVLCPPILQRTGRIGWARRCSGAFHAPYGFQPGGRLLVTKVAFFHVGAPAWGFWGASGWATEFLVSKIPFFRVGGHHGWVSRDGATRGRSCVRGARGAVCGVDGHGDGRGLASGWVWSRPILIVPGGRRWIPGQELAAGCHAESRGAACQERRLLTVSPSMEDRGNYPVCHYEYCVPRFVDFSDFQRR